MTFTLSDEEREMLSHALAHYVDELHGEINHTDDHGFKSRLKHEEHVLQDLVARLGDKRQVLICKTT